MIGRSFTNFSSIVASTIQAFTWLLTTMGTNCSHLLHATLLWWFVMIFFICWQAHFFTHNNIKNNNEVISAIMKKWYLHIPTLKHIFILNIFVTIHFHLLIVVKQHFFWAQMELMYIIWISTFLFCDAFSTRLKDRQVFHLQPFDAANKTDGAYRSGVAPSAKQRVKTRSRRISDKRVAAEISLEGGEAKEPSATDDLVFDAGEDERLLEYEDDYRVLKKEYATVERTQMISNERDFEEDSACWWIFCYLSSKSAFILIVVVLLTLFWCYSGMVQQIWSIFYLKLYNLSYFQGNPKDDHYIILFIINPSSYHNVIWKSIIFNKKLYATISLLVIL